MVAILLDPMENQIQYLWTAVQVPWPLCQLRKQLTVTLPGATGGIPGPCPPSEDCATKKLTGSGLLECKSRPKTPELVFTVLEFASKSYFLS